MGAAWGGESEPWEEKGLVVGAALGVLSGLVWALLLDTGCTLCLRLGLLLLRTFGLNPVHISVKKYLGNVH